MTFENAQLILFRSTPSLLFLICCRSGFSPAAGDRHVHTGFLTLNRIITLSFLRWHANYDVQWQAQPDAEDDGYRRISTFPATRARTLNCKTRSTIFRDIDRRNERNSPRPAARRLRIKTISGARRVRTISPLAAVQELHQLFQNLSAPWVRPQTAYFTLQKLALDDEAEKDGRNGQANGMVNWRTCANPAADRE